MEFYEMMVGRSAATAPASASASVIQLQLHHAVNYTKSIQHTNLGYFNPCKIHISILSSLFSLIKITKF